MTKLTHEPGALIQLEAQLQAQVGSLTRLVHSRTRSRRGGQGKDDVARMASHGEGHCRTLSSCVASTYRYSQVLAVQYSARMGEPLLRELVGTARLLPDVQNESMLHMILPWIAHFGTDFSDDGIGDKLKAFEGEQAIGEKLNEVAQKYFERFPRPFDAPWPSDEPLDKQLREFMTSMTDERPEIVKAKAKEMLRATVRELAAARAAQAARAGRHRQLLPSGHHGGGSQSCGALGTVF